MLYTFLPNVGVQKRLRPLAIVLGFFWIFLNVDASVHSQSAQPNAAEAKTELSKQSSMEYVLIPFVGVYKKDGPLIEFGASPEEIQDLLGKPKKVFDGRDSSQLIVTEHEYSEVILGYSKKALGVLELSSIEFKNTPGLQVSLKDQPLLHQPYEDVAAFLKGENEEGTGWSHPVHGRWSNIGVNLTPDMTLTIKSQGFENKEPYIEPEILADILPYKGVQIRGGPLIEFGMTLAEVNSLLDAPLTPIDEGDDGTGNYSNNHFYMSFDEKGLEQISFDDFGYIQAFYKNEHLLNRPFHEVIAYLKQEVGGDRKDDLFLDVGINLLQEYDDLGGDFAYVSLIRSDPRLETPEEKAVRLEKERIADELYKKSVLDRPNTALPFLKPEVFKTLTRKEQEHYLRMNEMWIERQKAYKEEIGE